MTRDAMLVALVLLSAGSAWARGPSEVPGTSSEVPGTSRDEVPGTSRAEVPGTSRGDGIEAPQRDGSPFVTEPDATLERYRLPFNVLAERSIGRTSRRVRFDWRRNLLQVAALGGLPAELNSFDSLRAGGLLRRPLGDALLELSLAYVWVRGSESTEQLALTPYRQPGRPNRLELDLGAAYAVAEGVVTPLPGVLPAAQLVLHADARLRYLIHPGGFEDMGWKDALRASVAGSLTDEELDNLESRRLPGMVVDPARYGMLAGLGVDLYLQSGLFLTYKLLVAVPLLAFMADAELLWGLELDLALGVAF